MDQRGWAWLSSVSSAPPARPSEIACKTNGSRAATCLVGPTPFPLLWLVELILPNTHKAKPLARLPILPAISLLPLPPPQKRPRLWCFGFAFPSRFCDRRSRAGLLRFQVLERPFFWGKDRVFWLGMDPNFIAVEEWLQGDLRWAIDGFEGLPNPW